jgi:general secretion pathway protein H
MAKQMHRSPGFTLLELLLVLLIGSVLAALVLPDMGARWQEMRMRQTVREVAGDLRQARSLALGEHQEAVVRFDLDAHRVVAPDGGRQRMLPGDVKMEVIAADSERSGKASAAIRFYPDGSASGGRVSFSTARSRLSVDVNWLTGRVTILDDEQT